jgi:hypothetical protein
MRLIPSCTVDLAKTVPILYLADFQAVGSAEAGLALVSSSPYM